MTPDTPITAYRRINQWIPVAANMTLQDAHDDPRIDAVVLADGTRRYRKQIDDDDPAPESFRDAQANWDYEHMPKGIAG